MPRHSMLNSRRTALLVFLTLTCLRAHSSAGDDAALDTCLHEQQAMPAARAPIRFLLSFDDGPSAAATDNPTQRILDTLEHNAIQPGIKSIFFVQTRAVNGGGTDIGRAMIARESAAGHVLGLHSATPRHKNHRSLDNAELDASLALGIADLSAATAKAPILVRPPFWNYDARTLAAYHRHGLQMLLTDLSANDGVIYGINFSMTKRHNMRKLLQALRPRWLEGNMAAVDGSTPIVVTFHDVNTYTASVLDDYLAILIDVAHELDLPLADKPFYDRKDEVERAALASVVRDACTKVPLPGIWNWIWH